jgi:hypothetical protein
MTKLTEDREIELIQLAMRMYEREIRNLGGVASQASQGASDVTDTRVVLRNTNGVLRQFEYVFLADGKIQMAAVDL